IADIGQSRADDGARLEGPITVALEEHALPGVRRPGCRDQVHFAVAVNISGDHAARDRDAQGQYIRAIQQEHGGEGPRARMIETDVNLDTTPKTSRIDRQVHKPISIEICHDHVYGTPTPGGEKAGRELAGAVAIGDNNAGRWPALDTALTEPHQIEVA